MTDISPAMTVGDIVACDLRSAAVFSRHGIDFCCGGRRSLDEACRALGLDPAALVHELDRIAGPGGRDHHATEWPIAQVVDRILHHHHAYIRRQTPLIQVSLQTLARTHGEAHPGLTVLATAFDRLADELTRHLAKEEHILFPFINEMLEARDRGHRMPRTPFGTIQNPVRVMELEHQHAGEDMRHIRALTDDFRPPADACPTWRGCYTALAEFERDLHEHVQLENTVLFPAAARLEEELV